MTSNPQTPKIIVHQSYETVRFDYQVSIDKITQQNNTFFSKVFAPPGREEPILCLEFYHGGIDFIVGLHLKSPKRVICKTSSWLLTKSNDKWKKQDEVFILQISRSKPGSSNSKIFHEQDSNVKDFKNELLPEGTLTFCTELTLELETFSEKMSLACPIKTLDRMKVVIDDLEKLLQSGEYSDFEFTIGQRKFPVHKTILQSRSLYFKAMFSQDFTEKTSNSASIEDVDAELFAELLDYIYTSNIPKFTDEAKATELMIIADRYQLEQLKNICEYELSANITVDSMFNLLMLADTYNASILKTNAIEFISSKASSKDILKGLFDNQQFTSKQSMTMLNGLSDLMSKKTSRKRNLTSDI